MAAALALAAGCDDEADVAPNDPGERAGPTLSGDLTTLRVDGTVLLEPLGNRAAERLRRRAGVDVTVMTTGVDNALNALCRGEIEIALVDRTPTDRELRVCSRNDVEPRRFQIAHQAVALYPGDRLAARVRCMTVGERAVQRGRYEPLSRPLYLLTSREALEQQPVRDYVRYVLQRTEVVAGYPGVVPLDEGAADRQLAELPSEAAADG